MTRAAYQEEVHSHLLAFGASVPFLNQESVRDVIAHCFAALTDPRRCAQLVWKHIAEEWSET